MQTGFNGSEQIGSLVADFPGASNVLKAYGIDFCCGGNRLLSDVIAEQQLDRAEVLQKLNEAYSETQARQETDKDWRHATYRELIEHIINRHHNYLRQEMPVLGDFITKIVRVHGPHQPELLAKVEALFQQMRAELTEHMVAEEEGQFPAILAYEETHSQEALDKALAVIQSLEDDHVGVGNILKELRLITSSYALPEWACRTYTLTFQKLEEMESDLFQHIHLENNILFPRLALEAKNNCNC
ncbi:MAG: iron-sulfur cluster repair di-iron protein [Gorillibacterium sp.]|nr:iron-sulfur cluster repair di-iron protein [Gorillibacterium sp.]